MKEEESVKLMSLATSEQVHQAIACAKMSEDPDVRLSILEQLTEHTSVSNYGDAVIDFLSDPDSMVRVHTIEYLMGSPNPNHLLHLLVCAYSDSDWLVRGWAVSALGCSGERALVRALEKIVHTDRSLFVQLNSWGALLRLGKSEALEPLLSFLQAKHYRLRIATCHLLEEARDVLNDSDKGILIKLLRRLIEGERWLSVQHAMEKLYRSLAS